jgi:hypothetical protein
MKARLPKPWENLPPKQKEVIAGEIQKILVKQEEKDMRIMLDLYIKMACVTLHDAFGFGEKRLTMFLGNHKRLFHRQSKMVKDGTQIEYLNRRMAEIFKKNGFPQGFFDNMLGKVIVKEENNEQREAD